MFFVDTSILYRKNAKIQWRVFHSSYFGELISTFWFNSVLKLDPLKTFKCSAPKKVANKELHVEQSFRKRTQYITAQ